MSDCIRAEFLTYAGVRHPRVRSRQARAIYERHVGPIPAGMQLHHECGNGWCINVAHLVPLTHREHVLRHRYHNLAAGFNETAFEV